VAYQVGLLLFSVYEQPQQAVQYLTQAIENVLENIL